jgi:hypothetical protein
VRGCRWYRLRTGPSTCEVGFQQGLKIQKDFQYGP